MNDLAPHSRQLNMDDMYMLKIGMASKVSSSLLPIGIKSTIDGMRTVRVQFAPPGAADKGAGPRDDPLQFALIAVLNANPSSMNSFEAIVQSNVAGFIFVDKIDAVNKRVMVLGPCAGPLPSKVFLTGSIQWFDQP